MKVLHGLFYQLLLQQLKTKGKRLVDFALYEVVVVIFNFSEVNNGEQDSSSHPLLQTGRALAVSLPCLFVREPNAKVG